MISRATPSVVSSRAGTAPACQAALSVISATRGDFPMHASQRTASGERLGVDDDPVPTVARLQKVSLQSAANLPHVAHDPFGTDRPRPAASQALGSRSGLGS